MCVCLDIVLLILVSLQQQIQLPHWRYGPQSLKYSVFASLQKKFVNHRSRQSRFIEHLFPLGLKNLVLKACIT